MSFQTGNLVLMRLNLIQLMNLLWWNFYQNSITGAPLVTGGIPCKVFKYCAAELAELLSDLLNLCISKQEIPGEWKNAMVRPLYKGKGARDELENYKPISNLKPLSFLKVFWLNSYVIISNLITCLLRNRLGLEKRDRVNMHWCQW